MFTVPQFLSRGRRRNDLLIPVHRGTMQAVRGMKNAPRPCRRKTSARAGERFWPHNLPHTVPDHTETAWSKRPKDEVKRSGNGQKRPEMIGKSFRGLFASQRSRVRIPPGPPYERSPFFEHFYRKTDFSFLESLAVSRPFLFIPWAIHFKDL